LRAIETDEIGDPDLDVLATSTRRVINSLAEFVSIADIHHCHVDAEADPPPGPSRRPRSFWAITGLSVAGLALTAILVVLQVSSVAVLVAAFLFVASAGLLFWSLLEPPKQPETPRLGTRTTLDADRLIRAVRTMLTEIDDSVRLLSTRLQTSNGKADVEIASDLLDLVHQLIGDGMTGRQRDRTQDLIDVLISHELDVITDPEQQRDPRFHYRPSPTLSSATVVRPALIDRGGALVKSGTVLVPQTDQAGA